MTNLMKEIDALIGNFKSTIDGLETELCLIYEKAFRAFSERDEKQFLDKLNSELFIDKRSTLAKRAFLACQILSDPGFDPDSETYSKENFSVFFSKKAGIYAGRNFDKAVLKDNYKAACTKYGKDKVILSLSGFGQEKKDPMDPILKAIAFLKQIEESYQVSRTVSEKDLPREHKKNLAKLEKFCQVSGNTYKDFASAIELLKKLR